MRLFLERRDGGLNLTADYHDAYNKISLAVWPLPVHSSPRQTDEDSKVWCDWNYCHKITKDIASMSSFKIGVKMYVQTAPKKRRKHRMNYGCF